VLEGNCEFTLKGDEPIYLTAGDFVLVPEAHAFTVASSHAPALDEADTVPIKTAASTYFVGEAEQELNAHLLIGHCQFEAPDSKILVSLLPKLVHLREAKRLTTLVELVIEESLAQHPGRDSVLARLLEILLIEAFRTKMDTPEVPGLLVGLADERLAIAIRKIHQDVSKAWTIDQLAKEASLSRSSFFQRFSKAVGYTPMEYVIAWRMAIAKDLLRRQTFTMATIAERIGYQSASAFSSAFSKHTGQAPSKFLVEDGLVERKLQEV
jgi:AraC-like DNA-binding protein